MMLTGRIDVRRGAAAILGAFILFGAAQIVAGVQSALAGSSGAADAAATPIPPPPATSPQRVVTGQPAQDDPYAGASVPR